MVNLFKSIIQTYSHTYTVLHILNDGPALSILKHIHRIHMVQTYHEVPMAHTYTVLHIPNDGPALTILKYMEENSVEDSRQPPTWKGYRALCDK